MIERVAHLLFRHGAQRRGAKAVGAVHQPADRHFADAVMLAHPDIAVVERDVAAMAGISAVEAAVEKEAERVQRTQRVVVGAEISGAKDDRSEEHTSELQSLMRISYAVFCLKNTK